MIAAAGNRLRRGLRSLQVVGETGLSIARTRRGRVDKPRLLTYIVTFRCNARCVMCDSWQKPAEDELTLAELDTIFRQLPRLHAVRLSGGEPFVRADFAEIADLAVARLRPTALHVTTNGFLTERIVRFCEQRDRGTPLELLVSVDGVEEQHDRIRGRRDAWDKTFATLQALAPRRRELNLQLTVNQTILDAEGAASFEPLRARLKPLNIENQIVVAYESSATYTLGRATDDHAPKQTGSYATFGALPPPVASTLVAQARRASKDYRLGHRIAKRYYLRGIESRLLHGRGAPNPPCVALNAHLRLFPNGDVPTCQFNGERVGNLRTQTFAELWSSPRMRDQRDWVRACAGCWAECEVLPNAIYSGDIVRALT